MNAIEETGVVVRESAIRFVSTVNGITINTNTNTLPQMDGEGVASACIENGDENDLFSLPFFYCLSDAIAGRSFYSDVACAEWLFFLK